MLRDAGSQTAAETGSPFAAGTKTGVKDKLRAKHQELAAGIRTPANYTVEQCLKDWLETLNTQAGSTVMGYWIMVRHRAGLLGTSSSSS